MDDSEVILNFDRVDMNTLREHSVNKELNDFISAGQPGAQSSPDIQLGARMNAGDCASLTHSKPQYELRVNNGQSPVSMTHNSRKSVISQNHSDISSHLPRQPNMREHNNTMEGVSRDSFKINRPLILPDQFNGSVFWCDYQAHFEMCSEVNKWNELEKAQYLAVSLRGSAQQVMSDLSDYERRNYNTLVKAISNRFNPDRQTELYKAQLRCRKRQPNESIPELGQAIKRIVRLAYPNANFELIDSLSRDHFLDAISDSNLRMQIYQARPTSIDEAVCVAIEFEAYQKAESQRSSWKRPARMINSDNAFLQGNEQKSLQTQIEELTKSLADFSSTQKNANREQMRQNTQIQNTIKGLVNRVDRLEKGQNVKEKSNVSAVKNQRHAGRFPAVECFNCGKKGHIARDCRVQTNDQRLNTQSFPFNSEN